MSEWKEMEDDWDEPSIKITTTSPSVSKSQVRIVAPPTTVSTSSAIKAAASQVSMASLSAARSLFTLTAQATAHSSLAQSVSQFVRLPGSHQTSPVQPTKESSPILPPSSQKSLSRTEIHLKRMLQRLDTRIAKESLDDPIERQKWSVTVTCLKQLLGELEVECEKGWVARHLVMECKRRIELVAQLVERAESKQMVEQNHAATALYALPPSFQSSTELNATVQGHLRLYNRVQASLKSDLLSKQASNDNVSSTKSLLFGADESHWEKKGLVDVGESDQRMALEHEKQLHADLTEEMVQLVTRLKSNVTAVGDILHRDEKTLDEGQQWMTTNLNTITTEGHRLAKFAFQSGNTTCCAWLLLISVIVVFIVIFLLMRLLPVFVPPKE